jgi:predicted dehydrogenase
MNRPRIGFAGTGWIGRHRMEAMIGTGAIEAAAIVDPSEDCAAEARKLAPDAEILPSFEAMLERDLDGVVIATPSALHAEQAIAALEKGLHVFCQKPLGRDRVEARRAVEAARAADRLLGVDLSYRRTAFAQALAERIRDGSMGRIFAADLHFHNAYGPDKGWFYDPKLSGGGCLIDLGVHLVDLALWALDWPEIERVSGRLYSKGQALSDPGEQVEDYATARIDLATGASLRIVCSWHLHAGQDADIGGAFHGTEGGGAFRNVGGSFYDFEAEAFTGTSREKLCSPPDEWGGREAAHWARQVAEGARFDPACADHLAVFEVLDRIRGRA